MARPENMAERVIRYEIRKLQKELLIFLHLTQLKLALQIKVSLLFDSTVERDRKSGGNERWKDMQ